MSNTLDDRTAMVKMAPEEEIAHWKWVAGQEKARADGEDKFIRERVFTAVWGKSRNTPSEIGYLIDDVDQAVQYILYGKTDGDLIVVPDSPLVPLADIRDFIEEKLDEFRPPLVGLDPSEISAKREILIELASKFGIQERNTVGGNPRPN